MTEHTHTSPPAATIRVPETGTVIHGTLRPEDLLEAFADELERIEGPGYLASEARDVARDGHTDEQRIWVLSDLFDALHEHAPPGHYFGAHEGDGSDFGFWPYDDDDDNPDQEAS